MSYFRSAIIYITAAMLALALAGCGSAPPKPSAENVKANRAMSLLSEIQKAYVARDMYGVLNHVSPTFESGYADFSSRMRKDTDNYPKVDLNLTVERVELDGDRVSIVFHWFGTWTDKSGNATEGRGNSIFTFLDAEKMVLVAITGDTPFGVVR